VADDPGHAGVPTFSLVTAAYDVARYLPAFIASVEAQGLPADELEVVAVDDGSTDGTGEALERWAAEAPFRVTVVHQENAGQAAARNTGIELARGRWLTFPDADDVLDAGYLATAARFVAEHPDVQYLSANVVYLDDETGERRETHPRRAMYRRGDVEVDLDTSPQHFPGTAPTSFVRGAVVREHGLRFDVELRPTFEDQEFCARYLLAAPTRRSGYLRSSRYLYRRRSDGTSTLQRSWEDPRRFTVVAERGVLGLLEHAAGATGRAPRWVQSLVLYELSFYFQAQVAPGVVTAAHGAVGEAFVRSLRRIAGLLDREVVSSFRARRFDPVWRDILLHGVRDEPWHTDHAVVDRYDPVAQLVRLSYRYAGTPPVETAVSRGRAVRPHDSKTRAHRYFDRTLLHERVLWISSRGGVALELDGRPVELVWGWRGQERRYATPYDQRTSTARPAQAPAAPSTPETVGAPRWARAALRVPALRRRLDDVWLLSDGAATDGEALFRYLRTRERRANAWFLAPRGGPAIRRLRDAGFRRVVEEGSAAGRLLASRCTVVVTSDPGHATAARRGRGGGGGAVPQVVLLAAGGASPELARVAEQVPVDRLAVARDQDLRDLVADGTTSSLTTREVVLTGAPASDDEACARVYAAIRAMRRPLSEQAALTPVEAPPTAGERSVS
jgi:GT2 family glycosyltransferase